MDNSLKCENKQEVNGKNIENSRKVKILNQRIKKCSQGRVSWSSKVFQDSLRLKGRNFGGVMIALRNRKVEFKPLRTKKSSNSIQVQQICRKSRRKIHACMLRQGKLNFYTILTGKIKILDNFEPFTVLPLACKSCESLWPCRSFRSLWSCSIL